MYTYLFSRCADENGLSFQNGHENRDELLQERRIDRTRCVVLKAITELNRSLDFKFDICIRNVSRL